MLLGEYFATKMSSKKPPFTGPAPKSTVPEACPTTATLPLPSVATAFTTPPSPPPPVGLICRTHRSTPPFEAVAVTVTTAASPLIAPCVSVTVSVAVYVPAAL